MHLRLDYKTGIPACSTYHVTNHVMVFPGNRGVDSFPVEHISQSRGQSGQ